jgi:hypothetical protein
MGNADFLFLEKVANFRNYCSFCSFNKWSGDIMHGHMTELTLTMPKNCSFVQITLKNNLS